MQRYSRYALYATVWITGAAVLIVEVTAVRMLSPFFGSSLFVLSSVLTIILGALSIGYYVGGTYADRYPFSGPLFALITISGLSILLLQYISTVILEPFGELFSVISGPVLLSLILFFIPAFLLGMVSPYVIALQTRAVMYERVGSVVGATFFWGTLGSIVGSLASGFLLIPTAGVQNTVSATGGVLVVLGVTGMLFLKDAALPKERDQTHNARRHLFIVLALVLLVVLVYVVEEKNSTPPGTLIKIDGLYSNIYAYEGTHRGETVRVLERDANNSSATYLSSYDLLFTYAQFVEFYPMLVDDAERFLILGGGAYSIPRTLVARNEDVVVDVVEIEPVLFDVAQEYFDLSDTTRITNYPMDARVYLHQTDTTYDVILGDTFGTDSSIPAHLATREFYQAIKQHLSPDGVFYLNFIGALDGEGATLTGSIAKTVASVFPNTKVYALRKQTTRAQQNVMLIARNGARPIDLGDVVLKGDGITRQLRPEDVSIPLEELNFDEQIILTDDRAPIEFLMAKQL